MRKTKVSPDAPIEAEVTEKAIKAEEAHAEAPIAEEKIINKVGNLLKEMRLQKGLRLTDVAKRLCIRKMYLEAIEESNYKGIPPFPYGVGFIRSYADFLGLNSSNIVELYKEETNTGNDKDMYVLEPQSEATVPNRKYLIISLLAIILIYVLWSVYNKGTEEEIVPEAIVVEEQTNDEMPIVVEDFAMTPETTEVEGQAIEIEPVGTEVSPQVTITEESFVEPKAATEEVKAKAEPKTENGVVLKIKQESWIEVKDSNKLYISKVLQPGSEYVVPEGGKGMILSIGKVEGVDVYVNGKLTNVVKPNKKTNIPLDPFLTEAH